MYLQFRSDAVAVVVHILNRMASKVLNFKTPLQVISNNVSLPTLWLISQLIFGCVAFIHLHKNQHTKLDLCTTQCISLEYATHKKGYHCYDPTSKHTYITMNVTLLKSKYFFSSSESNSPFQGKIQDEEQNWRHCPRFEDS